MSKITRKFYLAAALAIGICTAGQGTTARAEEKMAGDPVMKMSDEQMKMAGDHVDKMKMMAADQAGSQQMTMDMAKMMVMDHMAMQMAMDPKFKAMAMQAMGEAGMKKVHDDAKMMAEDPKQMAKMQQDIMADPRAMQMTMHMAGKMAMMHDNMSMMKDGKMKDMPADKK